MSVRQDWVFMANDKYAVRFKRCRPVLWTAAFLSSGQEVRNCHEITFQICFGKCPICKHFPKQECKVISKTVS